MTCVYPKSAGNTSASVGHYAIWRRAEAPRQALARFLADVRLLHLHPDQVPDKALRRFGDFPMLAVVSRAEFGKLKGVITLRDILHTYRATDAGMAPSNRTAKVATDSCP